MKNLTSDQIIAGILYDPKPSTGNAGSRPATIPAPATAPIPPALLNTPATAKAAPSMEENTEGLDADNTPVSEHGAYGILPMDPDLEKLIPWRIVNFQQEKQFTRPYIGKDNTSSLRLGQAICRLKASSDEAPFYVPMTIARFTNAQGVKSVRISLPATQRGGGAWAQGALRTDTARGKRAVETWKNAVLDAKNGPFAKWAATQDWAAFNASADAVLNTGVIMEIPGLNI